jgi:nanoRNase/pAp phosphatase (c-di-AMP/oligoRNAs hydrolase)
MVSRLVLGYGNAARGVVDDLASRPGRFRVIVDGRRRAESLRDASIDAVEADPSQPENYPPTVDAVLVLGDDPDRNRAAAVAARDRYPAATIVAYAGVGADDETREALSAVADRIVDPAGAVAERALAVASGELAGRLRKLLSVLRGLDGRLAVIAHDNPDPDAIGSALALSRIADSVGVDADVCYFGDISHQENRALVNLLDLDLRNLPVDHDMSEYAGVALVDHSRPGINDGLSPDTRVDVVVDHHPPRAPVEAGFIDLRSDVGATSTLLVDYLRRLDVDPGTTVATALLFGIRVDTNDFVREVSPADFDAAAYLLPRVDAALLDRIESPSMSAEVLETIGRAIRNREVEDGALASCVGAVRDRDALAQAADRMLTMEGIDVAIVYGFRDGSVYVSGRARGADVDIGETLRAALGPIGSAGGHADMAGAQIPLGILADVDGDSTESLTRVIRAVISGRFFETLETVPGAPGDAGDADGLAFELPLEDT